MERLSLLIKRSFGSLLGKVFYALFFTTQCFRIEKQLKSMFLLLICDNSETTNGHFFNDICFRTAAASLFYATFFFRKQIVEKDIFLQGIFFRLFHHEQECLKIENCVQPSNTLLCSTSGVFPVPVILPSAHQCSFIFISLFYDEGQGWVNM